MDWTVAGNYGDTSISSVPADPAPVANSYPVLPPTVGEVPVPQHLYDATAKSLLTSASPKFKIGLGALWTYGDFTVNLRETIYGPTKVLYSPNGGTYYNNEVKTAGITDLEIDYAFTDMIGLAVGANNLFDKRPESMVFIGNTPSDGNNNVVNAPLSISPYGINGGFYYGKISFKF